MYTHPDVMAVVREWLAADPGVTAAVHDRVSTSADPGTGAAQIVISNAVGGPTGTAQNLGHRSKWAVSLWVSAGRRNGDDDIPDRAATQAATAAVYRCADRANRHPYQAASGVTIDAASISNQTGPVADPQRHTARTTLTVAVSLRH